jgi:hypothetical protein
VAIKRIAASKLGKSNNRRLLEQEISILKVGFVAYPPV